MERQSRYAGLTAIERLDLAGLRSQFDTAARARGRSEMVRLLTQVELPDASWLADTIISNPRRHGY
jgi:hypothetical protein